VTGRWVDWLLHAKWSSDKTIGFIEIWADTGSGLTLVLPRLADSNMYVGLRNFWTIGLYRNGRVGDQTIRYLDANNQPNGPLVWPEGPALPVTVVYFDGFIVGATKESIYREPLNSALDIFIPVTTNAGNTVLIPLSL